MNSIIEKLKVFDKRFPYNEVQEAIKRKDEITPILLDELDKIIQDTTIVTDDDDYMLHFYSLFLLAQFKEKKAFSIVCFSNSICPSYVLY